MEGSRVSRPGIDSGDLGNSVLRQGSWALLLGDIRRLNVLTLDATLGATAIALARLGANVTSVQTSRSEGEAVADRCKSQDLSNIRVVVGSLNALPLKEAIFDIVCVHNMSRIVMTSRNGQAVRNGDLLTACLRLIADGGRIYVSGGKRSIRRRGAEHDSLLIQTILKLIVHKWNIEAVFDSYANIDNPYAIRIHYPRRMKNGLFELLKFFIRSNNFGVISRKNGTRSFGQFSGNMVRELGLEKIIEDGTSIRKLHIGTNSVIRLHTRDKVIKIPLTEHGLESCQANMRALLTLEKCRLPFRVPRSLGSGLEAKRYFIEEKIAGSSIDELKCPLNKLSAITEQAIYFLDELYKDLGIKKVFNNEMYLRYIGNVIDMLRERVPHDVQKDLDRCDEIQRNLLVGRELLFGLCHGDFKISNFLLDRRHRIIGIVDWDRFDADYPSFVDVLLLVGYNGSLQNNTGWVQAILSTVTGQSGNNLLKEHFRTHGVDRVTLKCYVILTVLHIIKDNRLNWSDLHWQRNNVFPLLAFIKKELPYTS